MWSSDQAESSTIFPPSASATNFPSNRSPSSLFRSKTSAEFKDKLLQFLLQHCCGALSNPAISSNPVSSCFWFFKVSNFVATKSFNDDTRKSTLPSIDELNIIHMKCIEISIIGDRLDYHGYTWLTNENLNSKFTLDLPKLGNPWGPAKP